MITSSRGPTPTARRATQGRRAVGDADGVLRLVEHGETTAELSHPGSGVGAPLAAAQGLQDGPLVALVPHRPRGKRGAADGGAAVESQLFGDGAGRGPAGVSGHSSPLPLSLSSVFPSRLGRAYDREHGPLRVEVRPAASQMASGVTRRTPLYQLLTAIDPQHLLRREAGGAGALLSAPGSAARRTARCALHLRRRGGPRTLHFGPHHLQRRLHTLGIDPGGGVPGAGVG